MFNRDNFEGQSQAFTGWKHIGEKGKESRGLELFLCVEQEVLAVMEQLLTGTKELSQIMRANVVF